MSIDCSHEGQKAVRILLAHVEESGQGAYGENLTCRAQANRQPSGESALGKAEKGKGRTIMPREQTGHVYKRSGFWVLRYRQTINQGGELKTIQKAFQLAPTASYKTRKSVDDLVKGKLDEINQSNRKPETVVTIGDFVTSVYLPFVRAQKRPSTCKGYADMWEHHFKARCESILLRDVHTSDVQRWLEAIAERIGRRQELGCVMNP
jgi:hypothetical protein